MDWKRLKNGICPSCGSQMRDKGVLVMCTKCDFKIRATRMKEILEDKPKQSGKYRPISELENLEMLNNDGLDEITEDFSDSPSLNY